MNDTVSSPQSRVVVVDDRAANLNLLVAMLEPQGYEVLTAAAGAEALTLVGREKPDLVVLDVAMPEVDGYEVCSRLKQSPQTSHIPIILISAVDLDVEHITRGLEAGADEYVTRPVDNRELLARVRSMLRIKHVRDELSEKQQALEGANVQLRQQSDEIGRLNEELRFQNAQLQVKNMLMELELDMAREVQKGLLPQEMPRFPGLTVAASYLPTGRVGGDLYDFALFDEDALGIFIADVAGHGLPAAFIAAMTKMSFDSYASTTQSPAQLLEKLNARLSGNLAMGLYVTMFYAIYHRGDRRLVYTRAGHPKPILIRGGSDALDLLDTEGHVVGAFEEGGYGEAEVLLTPGDTLVLFTDGVNECVSPTGESFGPQRLEEAVRRHRHLAPRELVDALCDEVTAWSNGEPFRDDVTLLAVTVAE